MTDRFAGLDGDTILDRKTGNEWRVAPLLMDWEQGKKWASGLGDENGAFRLPAARELKRLCSRRAGPQNIDPVFGLTNTCAWTAETKAGGTLAGYFSFGRQARVWNHVGPGHEGHVLAVRKNIED